MELGRVMSDAPYGIRGVANNLSQFASQMAFAAKSTGSLTLAFKDLWKALMGPLGILLAIQGVIAIIEKMSMSKKKAKEDSEELNSALERQRKELRELTKGYDDLNKVKEKVIQTSSKEREKMKALVAATLDSTNSDERKQRALSQLIKLYPKYFKNLKIGDLKNLYDAEEKVDRILQRKLKLKHQLERAEEIANEIQIEKIKIEKDSKNADLDKIGRLRDEQKQVRELIQIYLASDMQLKLDKDEDLGKVNKISTFDTPEELELKIKDTLNARQKLAQKTEMINLKTEEKSRLAETQNEEDKTFIKEEYALRRLKITEKYEKKAINAKADADIKSAQDSYNTYIKKINKEVVAFEDKLKKDGKALTKAEKKMLTDAKKVASDKKESAKTELTDAIILIEAEYGKLFPFWKKMAAARRTAIGQDKPIGEAEEFTLQDGLKKYMEVQSSMTSFLGGEYDRQLTIEQNKTNALNNELNQRLLNENLSKDERERIQLQIGQNDEKLRKKQEAIEKKRFKLNKAANIAGAAINTYLAASQIMADPSFVGRPVARFAAMATAITTGLLNVAKIARQKFQSSAGSGGSIGPAAGGNGEGESREFNFNLAGSTQTNQLTQSIAGQLSQPIQAYVVSSEITSQQQLDLNIANTATIG